MNKYKIEDFLEVKSSSSPRFSPNASKIAYLSNTTGTYQLYLVAKEGGEPVQLTDFSDPITDFIFSPTENKIVFSKSEGGDEKAQLYFLDVESKAVEQITDKKEFRFNLGQFSFDGRLFAYSSNERNGNDFDVYVMDVTTREVARVFSLGDWSVAMGFSPSGKYLSVKRLYSLENCDVYICDLTDGTIEHVTPHEESSLYGAPRWLPDESALYLTSDDGLEFMGLAKYSLMEKKLKYVLKPDWDIDGTLISRDGRMLLIMLNEEGYIKMTLHDPSTLKTLPYEFPKGQISGVSFSIDCKYLLFSLGDSRNTTDIWFTDLESGKSKRVTNSPQGVPAEVLVEPELIRFESFDGLEVPAFVYKPKNIDPGKKLPVIIHIHGGPESQYQPSLMLLVQYFVYAGYIVVAPNVRGSTGYGKTYLGLDNVEKRMDSVKDIVALREYLKNYPEVDVDKAIVMGGSYGGFMVLACMAFYPDLWVAGVDTVGIVNFISFLENTAAYRRPMREAEYGSLERDREFLKSISPINSVQKIKAPLFVIHGANDPRVPLSEAEQVVGKLRELGREVEFLVYQDEGHGLNKLKNRLDAYPKVVEFLDKVTREKSGINFLKWILKYIKNAGRS